jgi:hypothetical protein
LTAAILAFDHAWPQTAPAIDKPSEKTDTTITTEPQVGETVLYGRLDSHANGICFTANDKNTYELTKSKEVFPSNFFWKLRGKTITIRGKPVPQRAKSCRFTFEVSSWSFFLEGERTENWDTYRNQYYGYEVKYPPWWHVTGQTLDLTSIHFQRDPGGYVWQGVRLAICYSASVDLDSEIKPG